MGVTRRGFLIGAGTGAVTLLLASCTPEPSPEPSDPTEPPPPSPTPDPEPTPDLVPPLAAFVRSSWTTDPYSRGAISYLPAGATPQHRDALGTALLGRLFFAGEAVAADHPGTVRGAVESGRRAAVAALAAGARDERVAVIGAGAAGAVAARALRIGGAEVTVFEARERVGGRLHSPQNDDWPLPLQLGAWLSSPEDGASLAETLDLPAFAQLTLDSVVGWTEEGEASPPSATAVEEAIHEAGEGATDLPLIEALEASGADPEDPELITALAWLSATTGADAAQASSWYPPSFLAPALTAAEGDVASFVEEALEDIEVTLASPVGRIAYDEDGASLRLATGEALSFDRVIVTVPLGVLQHQAIEFAPALPFAHRGAISALGTGSIEQVWVRFDEAFWETDAAIWQVSGDDVSIRTWINLEPATGQPVLVGIVGGEAATEFAALGDDEAQSAVRASLRFFAPEA